MAVVLKKFFQDVVIDISIGGHPNSAASIILWPLWSVIVVIRNGFMLLPLCVVRTQGN